MSLWARRNPAVSTRRPSLAGIGGGALSTVLWAGIAVGAIYTLWRMFGRSLPVHNINESDIAGAGTDAKKAAEFYEAIQWGKKPDKVIELGDMSAPKWLVEIGDLKSVIYDSDKGGEGKESYIHHFKKPLPKLSTDPEGRRLFVAGGGYHTNWRGIVG